MHLVDQTAHLRLAMPRAMASGQLAAACKRRLKQRAMQSSLQMQVHRRLTSGQELPS